MATCELPGCGRFAERVLPWPGKIRHVCSMHMQRYQRAQGTGKTWICLNSECSEKPGPHSDLCPKHQAEDVDPFRGG